MARNGSGTHSIPNTMVAGTTITAADHNENYSDISTELTNSVAADGQTTMTGPLKASSGTVSAPSHTFGADTDTGAYRIGADNYGIAVGGTKIVDVASTGATVTGTLAASGNVSSSAGLIMIPVGIVMPYAGDSAPSGYLLCYGQAVSRTTYSALFTAISTTYGTGDGSTTFNLPDLRGRVPAGQDDMGGTSANRLTNADDGLNGDTLGATGGGETQTLVTGNLPAYTPTGSIVSTTTGGYRQSAALDGANNNYYGPNGTTGDSTDHLATVSTFTGTAQGGTSTAFGIVQPTIILNYIIFAGV